MKARLRRTVRQARARDVDGSVMEPMNPWRRRRRSVRGRRSEGRSEHARRHGMSTFVLIHGAGDVGWYWHLVEAELRERGHDSVAPDLPCDDDAAGLPEYADAVVDAIGDRTDLIVVAQSLGGFTAPLVCDRVPVKLLVLVAPMIPAPGEAPADYWTNTKYGEEGQGSYEDD